MGEFTRCNYCDFRDLQRKTPKDQVLIRVPVARKYKWIDVYRVPKDLDFTNETYNKQYKLGVSFAVIPNHCCC